MKNYFSFSLYKEGLAQLALPGFITGGIVFAVVMLQGWSEILHSLSRSPEWGWTPCISEAWAPALMYAWAAPLLFAIVLFGFLNNRKKSDYYHALPVRRETLFLSFGAAIYTWLIATVVLAVGLGTLLFAIAGAQFGLAQLGTAALGFIPTILYMTAIILLAMTLTGTLFSNVVLAGLFFLMPPLVSELFSEGVVTLVPALPFGEASFFGISLGLTPFTFFIALIDGFGIPTDQLANGIVADALWTSFLALALLALATLFFVRRKSETAGNSAPSKRIQAVYRVAIVSPVLMIAALLTSIDFATRSPLSTAEHIFALSGSVAIALILVCAFELISTKTWRNLLKIPASFGIALVVAAVFVGSVWAVAAYEASFAPRPENIAWVSIPNDVRSNQSHMSSVSGRGIKGPDFEEEWRGDEILLAIWRDELRVSDDSLNQAMTAALVESRSDIKWLPNFGPHRAAETERPFYDAPWYETPWHMRFLRNETLVFEIRTTSGITKRRTLAYAETDRAPVTNETFIIPNQLGEAIANLRLR